MQNKTKVGRFVNALDGVAFNRRGTCQPDQCETLDGRKGHACCHLDYKCPLLNNGCSIYPVRPLNCRVFPKNQNDLKLVKNCSYYFVPVIEIKKKIVI